MTIWERVEDGLEDLNLPMAPSLWMAATGQSIPDTYLVYSLISSIPEQHADNEELSRSYHMQVSYYARSGLAGMPDIPGAMVDAGFTRGPTRELPYNPDTRHYGLALEFWFYEE